MNWDFRKDPVAPHLLYAYVDGVQVAKIRIDPVTGRCKIEMKDSEHESRNIVAAKVRLRGIINKKVKA